MKVCGELMNKEILCCSIGSKIDKVAKIMRFTDQSYVPIVDDTKNKRVLGAVSDRDLLHRVLSEGKHPVYTLVSEIISNDFVTCGANAPVDFVLSLMSNNGVTNISVVDSEGKFEGVISLADIADYYQYSNSNLAECQSA